jgi:hypothetical protein
VVHDIANLFALDNNFFGGVYPCDMGIFTKLFPSPVLKTMLAALEVVSDDLRRNCGFSPFGYSAYEKSIRGAEKYVRGVDADVLTAILADGTVTPLLGIWKVIHLRSYDDAMYEEQHDEKEAYAKIYVRSVNELERLNFYTKEQALQKYQNFIMEFSRLGHAY